MPTHEIVFIGASFGALPAAHHLLRDVLPKLTNEKHSYKVTIVSSSKDFYWKIGSPRTIVDPNSLPIERVVLPIEPEFKKYGADRFEFVHAAADKIDSARQTITLSTGRSLHYDSLVIASGTSFVSSIWSVTTGTEDTLSALKDVHARIPKARTILVAGGGAAGVETAGELGHHYGNSKEIIFLSGSTQLLSKLQNKKPGRAAEKQLERLGVKVINDRLQVRSSERKGNQDVLQLSDGTTRTVDVFIEATGDRPNSKFVPEQWLNERKFVKTEPTTLRLDVPGVHGVYCIGSVGSYSDGSVLDARFGTPALVESIKFDLMEEAGTPAPIKRKALYHKHKAEIQIVPVGPSGGVGVIFGYSIPSFFVWFMKSRDFMIGHAANVVNGTF